MATLRSGDGIVTQITCVEAEPGHVAMELALMQERARFMASQPGFVSITLHRSLDGRRIVNYIQWRDRDSLARAHHAPEFRREWAELDALTESIEPRLYEVVEVHDSRASTDSTG